MRSSLMRLSQALSLSLLLACACALSGAVPKTMADEAMVHMVGDCAGSSCQFSFLPATITLPAGSAITFMNLTTVPHTATSDSGAFDTGTIQAGGLVRVTFPNPGTYPFHCAIHPSMHGTVVITGTAPTATAALTAAPSPTAAATPTPTSAPSVSPTSTPAPATPLAVQAALSPRRIHAGHPVRLEVHTLPAASLIIRLTRPGAHSTIRRAVAVADGSYQWRISIGKRAKPGKLTVRVTGSLGGQSAQAVASATIR
jgi:plastocyanin